VIVKRTKNKCTLELQWHEAQVVRDALRRYAEAYVEISTEHSRKIAHMAYSIPASATHEQVDVDELAAQFAEPEVV
jgi:hypothetical protein